MYDNPRFTRGTSVIAALVFAALLGAIALGLHTFQSGSTNTAALPAQAGAPAGVPAEKTSQCKAGYGYEVVTNTSSGQTNVLVSTPPIYDCASKDKNSSVCTNKQGIVWYQCKANAPTVVDEANRSSLSGTCQWKYCIAGQDQVGGSSGTLPSDASSASSDASSATVSPNTGTSDAVGAYCVTTDNKSGTIGSDGITCVSSGANSCTDGASNPPDCTKCPTGMTIQDSTCQITPANTGPQGPLGGTPTGCYDQNGSFVAQCPSGAALGSTVGCTNGICSPAPAACQAGTYDQSQCRISGFCTQYNTASACTGNPNPTAPATPVAPPCTSNCSPAAPPAAPPADNSALLSLATGLARGLAQGLLSPCGMPGYGGMQSTAIGGNGSMLVPVTTIDPNGFPMQTMVAQPVGYPSMPYGGMGAMPCSPYGYGAQTPYPQTVPASGNSTFSGPTPTPQISCSPQVADVGMSVAISYSCADATGSSGSGFSTGNQLSGSASAVIAAPPSGTNTANYGLTCTNNGQVASAQCSVQITQPAIDLVANPQSVQSGQTSSIGWVTAGMQSCVISSPNDSNFTANNASDKNANGAAQTDAITASTEFDLTCQTLGGKSKTASTVVTLVGATSTASTEDVTVSSSAEGQTVNHGNTVTITWNATSSSASAVALWLIDISSEQPTALIAGGQSLSGSYQWQLPSVGAACNQNSYAPCPGNLVDGDSYGIEAALYTPQDAYIGPAGTAPSGSVTPTYSDYGYTANTFSIGQ